MQLHFFIGRKFEIPNRGLSSGSGRAAEEFGESFLASSISSDFSCLAVLLAPNDAEISRVKDTLSIISSVNQDSASAIMRLITVHPVARVWLQNAEQCVEDRAEEEEHLAALKEFASRAEAKKNKYVAGEVKETMEDMLKLHAEVLKFKDDKLEDGSTAPCVLDLLGNVKDTIKDVVEHWLHNALVDVVRTVTRDDPPSIASAIVAAPVVKSSFESCKALLSEAFKFSFNKSAQKALELCRLFDAKTAMLRCKTKTMALETLEKFALEVKTSIRVDYSDLFVTATISENARKNFSVSVCSYLSEHMVDLKETCAKKLVDYWKELLGMTQRPDAENIKQCDMTIMISDLSEEDLGAFRALREVVVFDLDSCVASKTSDCNVSEQLDTEPAGSANKRYGGNIRRIWKTALGCSMQLTAKPCPRCPPYFLLSGPAGSAQCRSQ
jgi:hypothetical protein